MKIREMERNGDLDGYRVNIVGGAALEFDAWFSSQQKAKNPRNGGGGEEPPSNINGDDYSDASSSFKSVYVLTVFFVIVALGIRTVLDARSKHRSYGHNKY